MNITFGSMSFLFVVLLITIPLYAEQALVIKTYVSDEPYHGTLSSMLNTTDKPTTTTKAVHYTVVKIGDVLHLLSCTPATVFSKCPTIVAGTKYEFRIEKSKAVLSNADTKKPIELVHVASEIVAK